MKKILTLVMLVVSLGAYAQHDHNAHASNALEQKSPEFKDQKVGTAYDHYIHLKP